MIQSPEGTYGLACKLWAKKEIYAVAADWGQASCPVMVWDIDEWDTDWKGRQVADFSHCKKTALLTILAEAARYCGVKIDEGYLESIVDTAAEIDDRD